MFLTAKKASSAHLPHKIRENSSNAETFCQKSAWQSMYFLIFTSLMHKIKGKALWIHKKAVPLRRIFVK
jgi:hypothetical protein